MYRYILILMILTQALTFNQNVYTIKIHHLQRTYVNPKYFGSFRIVYGHYNRTHRAISAYIKVYKMLSSPGFKVLSQVYIGIQNVYKVFAPLRLMVDACQVLKSNLFGVDIVKSLGNITDCPILPGIYYVNNFFIDDSKYPPNMPEGHYMIHFTYFNYNVIITNFTVAYEIKYK